MANYKFAFKLTRTEEVTHVVSSDSRDKALALALEMVEQENRHEIDKLQIELIDESIRETFEVPYPTVKAKN
jgi:uncharacterized protein with von Willebrand factor type A (vWA) domain